MGDPEVLDLTATALGDLLSTSKVCRWEQQGELLAAVAGCQILRSGGARTDGGGRPTEAAVTCGMAEGVVVWL